MILNLNVLKLPYMVKKEPFKEYKFHIRKNLTFHFIKKRYEINKRQSSMDYGSF